MTNKFDWNDITIVPATLSEISSRKEINPFVNGKLPIFTAPMDMVVSKSNISNFEENNINICLPRHIRYDDLKNDDYFYSYGLDEIISIIENNSELPSKVLIDVANGQMQKLYDTAKLIKEKNDNIELMVGNIANPETYRKYCEIGVDWIRVGIGGGSACTTSANVAIHYPMASLVSECYNISKEFSNPTKIIADGGFRNFSDIIKALALGASACMLGGVFNKALESCSDTFMRNDNGPDYIKLKKDEALKLFKNGHDIYKYYRGMSTKEVQKSWNRKELKTGEGITKYNKVEYTLAGWTENFTDYLKSAMSYCNSKEIEYFRGKVNYITITQNAFERFNK